MANPLMLLLAQVTQNVGRWPFSSFSSLFCISCHARNQRERIDMVFGAPQVGGVGYITKHTSKVGVGSPVLLHVFLEFYICFISSSPTTAAFITMYIGMGTYPGRWKGRTDGRSVGVHGIGTRCSVDNNPSVIVFWSLWRTIIDKKQQQLNNQDVNQSVAGMLLVNST